MLNGHQLYSEVSGIAMKFPMFILTNFVEDAYQNNKIESEKVLDKRTFFDLKSNQSKEIRHGIYRNIKNFRKERDDIIDEEKKIYRKLEDIKPRDYEDFERIVDDMIKIQKKAFGYLPEAMNFDIEQTVSIDSSVFDLISRVESILKDE